MHLSVGLHTMCDILQFSVIVNLLLGMRSCYGNTNRTNSGKDEQLFHKPLISDHTATFQQETLQNSQEHTDSSYNVTNTSLPSYYINDTFILYNGSSNDVIYTDGLDPNATEKPRLVHTNSDITQLEVGSQTYVIIMLSTVVLFALLFTMFGLFMKAEAHSKAEQSFNNGLLDNRENNHFPLSLSYMDD